MIATELVDLAALIALNGRLLVLESERLVDDSLQTYWSASRCRLDRWGRGLRTSLEQAPPGDIATSTSWSLLEEIFASEILSRMTAAMFLAHDQFHHRDEAAVIGRNVLYGHIDSRRRALRYVQNLSEDVPWLANDVKSLFARCSCWNDLLLGYLLPHCEEVAEFAFDRERTQEFACDVDQHAVDGTTSDLTATFLRSSLRMALKAREDNQGFSPELNAQIASAVIGCFGPEMFDSFGLLKSTWQQRMERVTDDTISLVDQLAEDKWTRKRWER